LVEIGLDPQSLADHGHEDINGHGDPDLSLHRVLAGAVEGHDSQVLLDPFEEPFHLPASLVDLGDRKCRKCEVVGQKLEPLPRLHVEITHTS
jgi:hypothetical protein